MMGGGPPMGSPFGGPSATESSAAAGLPFAGMPSELAERAERILEHEPVHPEPDITFDPVFRPQRLTITSLVTPHAGAVFVAVALLVAETVTMLAGPALTQVGIDRGVQPADKGALVVTVLLFVFAVAANTVLTRSRLRVTGALGERLVLGLRVRVFSHLQRLSMDFYTDSKSGVLLSRMTSDIESLSVLLQEGFVNLMVQALTLLFVTLVLFYYNATLALVVIVVVVPPLLALTLWFRSASSRGYDAIRDRVAEVLADLSENLAGIRVVVSSNRQARNSAEHRRVVGRYRDANLVTARAGAIYGPASEGIGLVAQAIVLLIGGRMVLRGDLALGELAAFVLYVTTFFAPIQQLVQLYNTYQQGQAAIRKLDGLLAEEPMVEERPGAPDLPRVEGRIELRGVTFSYRPGQPVLHDLDLVIEAGETFALVGDTGAGKSTVARLISRFHDPDDGTGPHRRPRPDDRDHPLDPVPARRRAPGAVPLRRHHQGQPRLRPPGRRPTRSSTRPSGSSASTTSSTGCPTASTPSSTSGARRCRRASGSCWRSAAPSSPGPGWWCSTRPRRPSTSPARPRWSGRSTPSCRAARPCSSPTG